MSDLDCGASEMLPSVGLKGALQHLIYSLFMVLTQSMSSERPENPNIIFMHGRFLYYNQYPMIKCLGTFADAR